MIANARIVDKLSEMDLDALVGSSNQNVFYLSGLDSLSQELPDERAFAAWSKDGRGPFVVLPAVDASILVDADVDYEGVYTYGDFYLYQSGDETADDEEVLRLKNERNYEDAMTALMAALEPIVDRDSRIAFEQMPLKPSENREIANRLNSEEIVPGFDVCRDLRRIKSDEEVRRLKRSVEINQASIREAIDEVEPGMTERELATIYQQNLVSRGAEPQFTVIGFGSHGAYPHAVPGARELTEGDVIRFDVGCVYENYTSDIARSFAFREADEETKRRYQVLNESMDRGIEIIRDGVRTGAVFDAVVEYVREEGADTFDAFDRNHVGHGIGIDVYDSPTINQDDSIIEAGMVMCVEPPYYELGRYGLQIEDEIHVTDDGVKRFSNCSDELRIVG